MTWNIRHGGGARVPQILQRLSALDPDVAVITEFRLGEAGNALQAGLREHGLCYQEAACSRPRQNSVLIAAKHELDIRSSTTVPRRTILQLQ